MERFAFLGGSHLGALAVTTLVSLLVVWAARRFPEREAVLAAAVGTFILGAGLGYVAVEALHGTSWRAIAPLHLCDLAVFVGAAALFTRRQQAFELLYFWGLTGTLLAMLTPELAEDFPHHRFLFYFAQHGSLVVGALFLVAGLRMRPREGAVLRALLWLNVVAVGVGVVDFAFDVNFLYLRHKPDAATPLDWFGPWPWYLVACEGLALVLFYLLSLPFARGRPDPRPVTSPSSEETSS